MYESFYGFSQKPFSLAPNPALFFASEEHKRGLAYLQYGLYQGQGIIVVTGMPGIGKTTLVRHLLADIAMGKYLTAVITNSNLDADNLLQLVASYFDVYQTGDTKASMLTKLEKFFLKQHRSGVRVILVVDEAQNLPLSALEELRMLSNFQHQSDMLVQIMLVGQNQLQTILAVPEMEQLTQRVIASYYLRPMSAEETRNYILHRLKCVGWRGDPRFSGEALALIYCATQGVSRLINLVCDRILLLGMLDEKHEVDESHVQKVLDEMKNELAGNWLKNQLDVELSPLAPLEHKDAASTVDDVGELTAKENWIAAKEIPVLNNSVNLAQSSQSASHPLDVNQPQPSDAENEPSIVESKFTRVAAGSFTPPETKMPPVASKSRRGMKVGLSLIAIGLAILVALYFEPLKSVLVSQGIVNSDSTPSQGDASPSMQPTSPSVPSLENATDSRVDIPGATLPAQTPADSSESSAPINHMGDTDAVSPLQTPVAETIPPNVEVTAERIPPVVVSEITQLKVAPISAIEANETLFKLMQSYQDGQRAQFVSTFVNGAVYANMRGKVLISRKYQELVDTTDMRNLSFDNIVWREGEESYLGEGQVKIATWAKGADVPEEQSGTVEIELVRNNDRVLVKNLNYNFE